MPTLYIYRNDIDLFCAMSIIIYVVKLAKKRKFATEMNEEINWETLSPEEKKKQLFINQKRLLDTFLEKKAISQAQYEKSLGDLRVKMGMYEVE